MKHIRRVPPVPSAPAHQITAMVLWGLALPMRISSHLARRHGWRAGAAICGGLAVAAVVDVTLERRGVLPGGVSVLGAVLLCAFGTLRLCGPLVRRWPVAAAAATVAACAAVAVIQTASIVAAFEFAYVMLAATLVYGLATVAGVGLPGRPQAQRGDNGPRLRPVAGEVWWAETFDTARRRVRRPVLITSRAPAGMVHGLWATSRPECADKPGYVEITGSWLHPARRTFVDLAAPCLLTSEDLVGAVARVDGPKLARIRGTRH